MRAVIQRVSSGSVTVGKERVSQIGCGLLVLLGVAAGDRPTDADYLAEKIIHLRVFEDATGKMNRSLKDLDAEMLVVPQFTLLGDCRKGRRPSFGAAAAPELALELYEHFMAQVRAKGISAGSGRFQAYMQVALVNDGPVTLIIESPHVSR